MKQRSKKAEAIFWSIALPGFGQILNGEVIKGLVFIFLEFLINVQSGFNEAIRLSFLGETYKAAEVINYQWLMFYPCLYMFAMWDAYRSAAGEVSPYLFLPFAFGAYMITVGLMYSSVVYIGGRFPGPVFFPMLALIPGLLIGFLIRVFWLRFGKGG